MVVLGEHAIRGGRDVPGVDQRAGRPARRRAAPAGRARAPGPGAADQQGTGRAAAGRPGLVGVPVGAAGPGVSPPGAGSGMIGGLARRVSSPVVIGRDAEAARLGAALERAAGGQPAIVLVAGEAGVGKTRLVTDLVGRAGELGAVALSGGCLDVGDGVLAYAPLVEALRPLVGLLDAAELERVLGGARGELARVVPELGPPPAGAGGGGRPAEAPLAPTRLFELLLGVLHRLAEGAPLLLVVEDLHWADQSTRDLLGFLVRNLRGGVALVLTYRSDELHRRHPLRPFLAELDRSGRAERLELERLGRRDLAELLAGILDEPVPPVLVGEILARSEGNPVLRRGAAGRPPGRGPAAAGPPGPGAGPGRGPVRADPAGAGGGGRRRHPGRPRAAG